MRRIAVTTAVLVVAASFACGAESPYSDYFDDAQLRAADLGKGWERLDPICIDSDCTGPSGSGTMEGGCEHLASQHMRFLYPNIFRGFEHTVFVLNNDAKECIETERSWAVSTYGAESNEVEASPCSAVRIDFPEKMMVEAFSWILIGSGQAFTKLLSAADMGPGHPEGMSIAVEAACDRLVDAADDHPADPGE